MGNTLLPCEISDKKSAGMMESDVEGYHPDMIEMNNEDVDIIYDDEPMASIDTVYSFMDQPLSVVKCNSGKHKVILLFRSDAVLTNPECVVVRIDLIAFKHKHNGKSLNRVRMEVWTISSLRRRYHWTKQQCQKIFMEKQDTDMDYQSIKEFVIQYVNDNPEYSCLSSNCHTFVDSVWKFLIVDQRVMIDHHESKVSCSEKRMITDNDCKQEISASPKSASVRSVSSISKSIDINPICVYNDEEEKSVSPALPNTFEIPPELLAPLDKDTTNCDQMSRLMKITSEFGSEDDWEDVYSVPTTLLPITVDRSISQTT